MDVVILVYTSNKDDNIHNKERCIMKLCRQLKVRKDRDKQETKKITDRQTDMQNE